MNKREFLMLAHDYIPTKHGIAGWYLSEKLDGQRCFWDGGVTRGMPKSEVPWANHDKDDRFVKPPRCTGLWTRYGNTIQAPAKWLNYLPSMFLDGELFMGRHRRQELMSTIRKITPSHDAWEKVRYHVFDIPSMQGVFKSGRINNPNFRQKIINEGTLNWFKEFTTLWDWKLRLDKPVRFGTIINLMYKFIVQNKYLAIESQYQLPYSTTEAHEHALVNLEAITGNGGEGVMLRSPEQMWTPERVHGLVKMKKLQDAEATVIGYVAGRETDRGSKLLGLMGALIVEYNGIEFELSGFTEDERRLFDPQRCALATPGEILPASVHAVAFPRGSQITFRFREHSRDGIPIEARYWRKA